MSMTPDAGSRRTPSDDTADPAGDTVPNPWNRVLGILVLGSFAAAAKTARRGKRPRSDVGRTKPDPRTSSDRSTVSDRREVAA
ncbi:MAG: hypothetical protein RIB65_07630 [Ilumatobacter fluminis]|uniref:hypothetical protein n=1 Tax=Ilumatobacter fluminis TaxID=467091 RepID=UPI0032F00F45